MSKSTTTKPELVTAFDIDNAGPDSAPVFQFVYASQLYGTLFGIYGRLKATFDSNRDCKIEEISLKLLNYQGVINIGFAGKPHYSPPDDGLPYECEIYFGVKAKCLRDKDDSLTVLTPGLTIPKTKRFTIIFNRILEPLEGFGTKLPPTATADLGKTDGEVPIRECFDTEFHTRSGEDYFMNPLRPGMKGYEGIDLEKPETLKRESKQQLTLGSPRCHQSIVKLNNK